MIDGSGLAVANDPAVDVNREELISEVLRMWPAGRGQSTEQLVIALRRASTEQLARAVQAESYEELNSILLGPVPNALGSLTGDYVYTAVTPCRIFDTRNPGGGGVIGPGGTRDFYVYGTVDIANQGGNPAGCLSPRGEPRAVHINVTAVPAAGAGNLRVYPQNAATPNASAVNFVANNIANALVVQTFHSLGPREIQVFASNTADVLADVLGYFYEADLTLGSGKTMTGGWAATMVATAASQVLLPSIPFPFRLATAPAAPAANFIPVGGPSTTACPGSNTNPLAAAGQLCVYATNTTNVTFNCIGRASNGSCNGSDPFGAVVSVFSTAAGSAFAFGTWAATAP
jgi:hypothetical protein